VDDQLTAEMMAAARTEREMRESVNIVMPDDYVLGDDLPKQYDFGIKEPVEMAAIIADEDWIDRYMEDVLDDPSLIEEIIGVPEGWDEDQIFEMVALVGGEFSPVFPRPAKYSDRWIGRALMQVVESFSDFEDAYASYMPQHLGDYERLAGALVKSGMIGRDAEGVTWGAFTTTRHMRWWTPYKLRREEEGPASAKGRG
jgi:hypothetical protein